MIIISSYEGTVKIVGVSNLTEKVERKCLLLAIDALSNHKNNQCLSYLNNVEIRNERESYQFLDELEAQGIEEEEAIDITIEYQ